MSNNYLIFDVGVGVSEVKISVIKSLLVPPPILNNPLGEVWEAFSFSKNLNIKSQPLFKMKMFIWFSSTFVKCRSKAIGRRVENDC